MDQGVGQSGEGKSIDHRQGGTKRQTDRGGRVSRTSQLSERKEGAETKQASLEVNERIVAEDMVNQAAMLTGWKMWCRGGLIRSRCTYRALALCDDPRGIDLLEGPRCFAAGTWGPLRLGRLQLTLNWFKREDRGGKEED